MSTKSISAVSARAISNIFLPPFVLLLSYSATVLTRETGAAIIPSFIVSGVLLLVVFPIAFFITLVKARKVSDQDAMDKKERTLPYAFGIFLMVLGLGYLLFHHAALPVVQNWISILLSIVFVLVINFRWKISAHLCSFTIAFCNLGIAVDPRWFAVLLLAPVLGWSRILLKSHTVMQVVAGFLLGVVLSTFSFGVINLQ